jgi:acyl dehydratase
MSYDEVEVGATLPERRFSLCRKDLVRYAGASGDLNPIHWDERSAREAGLPGVIAHGMLTMGLAARVVTDWAGARGTVTEYRARFRRPVPVPDTQPAEVTVTATVKEKLPDHRVAVSLSVYCGSERVLSSARIVVHLP